MAKLNLEHNIYNKISFVQLPDSDKSSFINKTTAIISEVYATEHVCRIGAWLQISIELKWNRNATSDRKCEAKLDE